MKKIIIAACAFIACATSLTAQSLYWDSNGTDAGAGSTAGTWGTSLFWNATADGTTTAPAAWIPNATAIFSAGTDLTGAFTVTVGSPQTVGKIVVEEGTPTFNGSTLTLNGLATVEVAAGRTAVLGTTLVSGSAGLTKEGAGILIMNPAVHNYSGGVNINAGVLQTAASSGGTNGNVTGTFGNPSGTITMNGGELRTALSRTTFNPITILQNTVFSKDSGAVNRTHTFTNQLTTTPGITVTLRNAGTAQFNLRFTGGANSDANWIIGQPGDGLCQLQLMGNTNWANQIFSGTISGPGILRRTSTATGNGASTIISGDNTYSGGTEINGGMIAFGRSSTGSPVVTSGPIGTGALKLLDDTVIGFYAHGAARTIGNSIVFGDIAFDLQIPGANDLTLTGPVSLGTLSHKIIVNNSGLTTFSGQISGSVEITNTGSGTLVWSGDNVNTGAITVDGGKFLVNNTTGSGTGSGTVSVSSGATLGGTGSISGATTVGGTVAPGTTGAGKLTFTDSLTLSGATYAWDLSANSEAAGSFDQIVSTGGVLTLQGQSCVLSLNFTDAATFPNSSVAFWQSARSWLIMDRGGVPGVSLTNFTTIQGTNGITAGTFSTDVGPNGVTLNYTPSAVVVPQPLISSITGAGTPNVTVTWSAVNGATYILQYKTNLNTVGWTDLDPVVASGSTASKTDTTVTSNERYYRVEAQ